MSFYYTCMVYSHYDFMIYAVYMYIYTVYAVFMYIHMLYAVCAYVYEDASRPRGRVRRRVQTRPRTVPVHLLYLPHGNRLSTILRTVIVYLLHGKCLFITR